MEKNIGGPNQHKYLRNVGVLLLRLIINNLTCWLRGIVVERRSFRPALDLQLTGDHWHLWG